METHFMLTIILLILLLIVSIQFYYSIDNFENINSTEPTLYVFVSKTCPHCVTYNEQTHPIVEKELANKNIKIKKIWANDDPDKLYDKFNVLYVPCFYLVKGDKKEKLSNVDPNKIKEIADKM